MKKRYLILPLLTLLLTSNVYAITSNDVTYNNDGTTENLTTTLDNLYSELNKYKTGGSVQSNQMLEGATGYSKGELVTGTIKSKAATTYTPGTSNQTIGAGQYLSGAQTIKGDANLVAGNIAKGKSIFGVSGTYTSDANATAANILSGKTAYVNGSKVTGTIASKAAATYTPGTSNQTITAGQYLSGAQTIKGDANLVAGNIAKGKSIFGVSGTYTSDATATAAAILSGYTAYVNGSKVTGTMVDRSSNTGTGGLSWAVQPTKLEMSGTQLRLAINPGYYGTSNYSSFGTPGIVINDFFSMGAVHQSTSGASNVCAYDWSLTSSQSAGTYIVVNTFSTNGKMGGNSEMNFQPQVCNYQVCDSVSPILLSASVTGTYSTRIYLVTLARTLPSGTLLGRATTCNDNIYGNVTGTSLWIRVGA